MSTAASLAVHLAGTCSWSVQPTRDLMRLRGFTGLLLAVAQVLDGAATASDALQPTRPARESDQAHVLRENGDPFVNCGAGEDGRDQPRGEGDSPFPQPWCCGNTTWSSFSFRAKFTRNVPFSLDPAAHSGQGMPPLPPGPWNKSQCETYSNCFSYCFNASAANFKTCAFNYTAPDEWSEWREFVPNPEYWCSAAYQAAGLDPISHLLVILEVRGIWFGNMSTITIEVRPEADRASEKTYQINATLSHIAPDTATQVSMLWPEMASGNSAVLRANFMVARANLTTSKPLIPERELNRALWAAMPRLTRSPQRIVVNHGYHGNNDVGAWREATKALIGLGGSAIHGLASNDMKQVFDEAKVPAVGFDGNWLSYHSYNLMGTTTDHWGQNLTQACGTSYVLNHTSAHDDHCWGATDAEVNAKLARWADAVVGPMLKVGWSRLTQLSLEDELAWHYPGFWEDTNAVAGNPRVMRRYKDYLTNRSGFTTPQQFGGDSWEEVVPAPPHNSPTRLHPNASSPLVDRRAFYWSIRFATWDVESWFAKATAALVTANGGNSFQIYTNWNNL